MDVSIRPMTDADLVETLDWLRVEKKNRGHSFFCNASVICKARATNEAFVACVKNQCVGLLVFGHDVIDIIAVRPGYRRKGVGRNLIKHYVAGAQRRGVNQIKAECVTLKGAMLCRALGFCLVAGHRHYVLTLAEAA